jgi:hypothetical protein
MANMTASRTRPRRHRAGQRSAEALPVWLRRFRVEVLLWAFREGRSIDAAALTAVLGAKHARDDEPIHQWSRLSVRALLWSGVPDWCEDHGVPVPPTTATTLWTVLDHLAARDGFDPGSDHLAQLREPLVDSGGLDVRTGNPRRVRTSRAAHPSTRRRDDPSLDGSTAPDGGDARGTPA